MEGSPSEPEGETTFSEAQPQSAAAEFFMDLDPDSDGAWALNHIFSAAASNPASPFLLSCLELPLSPLWSFSDDHNNGSAVDGAVLCLPEPSSSRARMVFDDIDNPDMVTESAPRIDDMRKLVSPFTGLMPMDHLDGSFILKERLLQALLHLKDLTEQQHVLAQVWAPVIKGDKYGLSTADQPFLLDPTNNGLHQYRLISLGYVFSIDGGSESLDIAGRVFRQKLPEWTPNVQYYSSREFSRLNHALNYNVRGTLALPVFEPFGQSCVGVLELIMTCQIINYAPEVEKVCKALEPIYFMKSAYV